MSDLGILFVALVAFAVGYKAIAWLFDRRRNPGAARAREIPEVETAGERAAAGGSPHEEPETRYARILGLPRNYTGPEITARYETLCASYEPARMGSISPALELRIEQQRREIAEAYAYFRAKYSLR